MLYPAQLYKEELNKKLISCWYLPKYKHYFGGEYSVRQLENDAYWHRDLVHLNSKGEVDGYIGYNYNDINRSINGVALIGFADNNTAFIKEVLTCFNVTISNIESCVGKHCNKITVSLVKRTPNIFNIMSL